MKFVLQRLRDLLLLIISSPFWGPLLAYAILITLIRDKKPIFYTQTRIGLHGEPFEIYKIRTMLVDARLPDDLRITKNGHFLREWSLDELPQLWNIFIGDMSFVGPRPLLWSYKSGLADSTSKKRHSVLPGLTGWAQVNGRNELNWEEKLDLDCFYVENQSIGTDFIILFRTLPVWLFKKGIYTKEGKMMPSLNK